MFGIYYTMNIVTSVGYGDMFPTTDIERLCTMFIILSGDALFAFAFGMMASLALETDFKDSLKRFLVQMEKFKKILKAHEIDEEIQKKVEIFYVYQ